MIVADTHTWLWWLSNRTMLSPAAREALTHNPIGISPITFWEITMLSQKGRIELDVPPLAWINDALERSPTQVLELSLEVAVAAGSLQDDRIRDPADRIIVATAMHHRVPLVTKDGQIHGAHVVETIW